MDGPAIITASKVESVVPINPHSELIVILGPTVRYAGYIQAVIGSLSVFLGLQAYTIASITFAAALYASKVIALQAYLATKVGAFYAYLASAKAASEVYRSKTLKMLRKKLFFEFAVFVLGGGGNAIILIMFWPGWLIIGGTTYAVWQFMG